MTCRYLFFGPFDWANVCNRAARAINATMGAGTARCFNKPHPFGYEQDVEITEARDGASWQLLRTCAQQAEWVVLCEDSPASYSLFGHTISALPVSRFVRTAIVHTGTAYREHTAELDGMDRTIAFDRRIIGGDLFRFALADPTAVPFFAPPHAEPVAELPPVEDAPVISHSPSNRKTKGTDEIVEALDGYNLDLIENVGFAECATRRGRSHIFVDQLRPDIGGFGASAVEALSAGCVTLASVGNIVQRVDDFYPLPPIIPVDTPDEMRLQIDKLLANPARLQRQRQQALNWARANATQKAIARYWTQTVLR